jgi:hypothetical protein
MSKVEKRTLFFASQGLKPQELEIAPEVQKEVESKRAPLIKEEVSTLHCLFVLFFKPYTSSGP